MIKTIDNLIKQLKFSRGKKPKCVQDEDGFCWSESGAEEYAAFTLALTFAKELKSHLDYYRWRKVEDELPEEDVDVLVYDEKEDHFWVTALLEKDNSYNMPCWYSCDGGIGYSITHWRYLDKPKE